MWTLFKIANFMWLLASSYAWFTVSIPLVIWSFLINITMMACIAFLPYDIEFDKKTGFVLSAIIGLVIWEIYTNGTVIGIITFLTYLPVVFLMILPTNYQLDLLNFVTKWFAISIIPSIAIYWILLFIHLPSIGRFVYLNYPPFENYFFYIKTTYDYGTFVRFNSYFPEPGHLAMPCEFLLMAHKFDFKSKPWLWVLLTAVLFSFSLAGYLLTLIGFMLLKINSIGKVLAMGVLLIGIIFGVQNFSGGDNAVNQLILDRLKYDQEKGIEGNNRYFNNTDFEFEKSLKSGDYWTGVNGKTNMELIGGSGFKIYILQNGLIGVLLVTAIYLLLIPGRPDWHYTLSFLAIIALCFAQNAYPGWYSWLFPYVLGLRVNRKWIYDDIGRSDCERSASDF